jgi:drug/metabolite transporter (DMT)-like permease
MLPSSGVSSLAQVGPVASSVMAVFLWGIADFSGGCGSRRSDAFVVTAFSYICAFAAMLAVALAHNGVFPDRASIVWALIAGSVGGFSLALFYRSLAMGKMGLSAPIGALLGAAIPTLVDIALEGAPSRWAVGGFVLAVVAIWLITRPEASVESDDAGHPKGVAMAALAGVGFAGFYLCIHQATGSPIWIATISRVGSLVATTVAIAAVRPPLAMDAPSVAYGAIAGIFDVVASALFIYASQRGRLDQAVVITSLYPAVTVLLARIVLKEEFSRWKFVGLLAALAAVPLIATG